MNQDHKNSAIMQHLYANLSWSGNLGMYTFLAYTIQLNYKWFTELQELIDVALYHERLKTPILKNICLNSIKQNVDICN